MFNGKRDSDGTRIKDLLTELRSLALQNPGDPQLRSHLSRGLFSALTHVTDEDEEGERERERILQELRDLAGFLPIQRQQFPDCVAVLGHDRVRQARGAIVEGSSTALALDRPLLQDVTSRPAAELDLVLGRIERATLAAPFDGLIVSGDLSQRLGAAVRRGGSGVRGRFGRAEAAEAPPDHEQDGGIADDDADGGQRVARVGVGPPGDGHGQDPQQGQ